MRLLVADGLDPSFKGAGRARKRTVANLQLDHVLALRLEPASDGEDIKGGFTGKSFGKSGKRSLACHVGRGKLVREYVTFLYMPMKLRYERGCAIAKGLSSVMAAGGSGNDAKKIGRRLATKNC